MLDRWPDQSLRLELARDVERLVAADHRVSHVERFGSLADDPDIPHAFSDIDIDVQTLPPTTDLEFAKSVCDIIAEAGPIRAHRTTWLAGFGYVEAVWFEGLPPYWHVDIRCRSAVHDPDEAYGRKDSWVTGYTHWMLSVKRLVRAFMFLAEHRGDLSGQPEPVLIPAVVVDDLRELLGRHHSAVDGIEGSDEFYAMCMEIDAALLAPTRHN